MESQRVGQKGRHPLFPDPAHAQDAGRGTGVVRQDGGQARLREAGRARRTARRGALRRLHRPGCDPHAVVCQHRRLCRHGHDGRHVGHGRLLRPDRQARPPIGRRGHRRRTGTRAGRPGHHRGQLLHRLAFDRGRGGACLPRGGARFEHRHHRLDAHHRRHGAGARHLQGLRAAAFGGRPGQLPQTVPRGRIQHHLRADHRPAQGVHRQKNLAERRPARFRRIGITPVCEPPPHEKDTAPADCRDTAVRMPPDRLPLYPYGTYRGAERLGRTSRIRHERHARRASRPRRLVPLQGALRRTDGSRPRA